MTVVVFIILTVLFVITLPVWTHTRKLGFGLSGILGATLLALTAMLLTGLL